MYKVEVMRVVLLMFFLLSPLAETCPQGCTCPSSRKVGCYNASLTSVPQDLDNKDVITLDVSHNDITELEQGSFKTFFLRYLFLNNNCITSISRTTFWSMPYLQHLFLNNNRITHIDHLTFLQSSNLKELDLSENQLTSLSEPIFAYTTSLIMLNLSGNRLTSLQFVIPMTAEQSVSKKLTLQVANNKLTHLPREILQCLGRFMKFDISNNTGLLCPCRGPRHPCSEYMQNWNEYLTLCLQDDDASELYHYEPTMPSISRTPVTTTTAERNFSTTTPVSTTKHLKVGNNKEKVSEREKLEFTVVIPTLWVTLTIISLVIVAYFIFHTIATRKGSPSETSSDLKEAQSDGDASDRPPSYAEVDGGLKANLLPYRLHLVTPVELNEPLYQAESVGSFIYTPPSEVYFDFSTTSARQLPPSSLYSQGRVPLERGLSIDGRSIYNPGIYNYDHIYEEIK